MELPLWESMVISCFLVLLSAVFSGLTLGILSLDMASLAILAEAGSGKEKFYAKRILPLRRDGNLLLCTLVIGNVIVNSFLSITLAELTNGLAGVLASTVLIVLLGEIIPQAACSRHGLFLASHTLYLTWFFIVLFYIAAKPIAMALDYVLGQEVGIYYSRNELTHLLKMQVKEKDKDTDNGILEEDHAILVGTSLSCIAAYYRQPVHDTAWAGSHGKQVL
jgi:metal transporter CNNM